VTLSFAEPTAGGIPARSAVPIADAAAGGDQGEVPDRDLTQAELLRLAASIAQRPELWRDQVSFNDRERHYASLHRDSHVDVWVLCWTPRNDTGWHDHDISSGAVAVVDGCLTENNLALVGDGITTDIAAGAVFSFGPDHIHRVTGRDAQTVSIHAYSPPLWRLGQYTVGADGVLHRTAVSYADELRPLGVYP
jgi:hypothetical protein